MARVLQSRRTKAAGEQTILGNPEVLDQEATHGLGATLRKHEVVVRRSACIGMTGNEEDLVAEPLIGECATENGEGREGPQWALSRAACFAELSNQRTRELRQMMP